jgi:hypothetical protein
VTNGTSPARDRWLAIGLISLVALLAYAPLLARLGFYRDDWYQLWAGETLGRRSIITLFSIDRPFMGYTYAAAFAVLRNSPLAWQAYALILRWIGALGALWLLRRLWPRQPLLTSTAALLFLVYPGFLQQPNANTFSNHLFGYAAGLLSLAATVEALQPEPPGQQSGLSRRRIALTAFAMLSGLVCWLIYEYMIGLEALRLLLIARGPVRESAGSVQPVRRWLPTYLPYLVPLTAYLVWRGLIFQAARGTVDVSAVVSQYSASPLASLLQRVGELAKDLVEAGVFGWFAPAYDLLSDLPAREFALGLLPAAAAVAALAAYARRIRPAAAGPDRAADPAADYRGIIWLGAFATLSALTPVVLAGRDVRWSSAFDRYTLHATLGLGILAAGLVFWAVRPAARLTILGLVLGLSVLSHQANARHWLRFWDEQRQLWWQLTWRAPDLEPGTVLLVDLPSQRFFEDYEVWGPANLIYQPGDPSPTIAAQVLEEETARQVRAGARDVRSMRVVIAIPRDYGNSLVVDWPSTDACVHVLEGSQPELAAQSSSLVRSLAPYSRSERILTAAETHRPPERIFGPEPPHGWCWYYQQATLARQRQQWETVAALAQTALQQGLAPQDRSEWMPFYQGYLNAGLEAEAQRLAALIREDPSLQSELCGQLNPAYFLDGTTLTVGRQWLCQ